MITLLIKHSPYTYSKFRKWLIKVAYKDNERKYESFIKLSEAYQYNSLIKFLEKEYNVPILKALDYYTVKFSSNVFFDQLKNTIIREFNRIENNKETEYNIF